MNARHQFKYTYNETDLEEYSPVEITMEIPADATLSQMLYNFERYLQAAGFVFRGHLDFVDDTFDVRDDYDDTLYEFDEEELKGGCMADFDKECGCKSTSSALEDDEYYKSKKLKEWSEGLAKLEAERKEEVKKNNWLHGMCNPPSPDWKKSKDSQMY